MAVSKNAADELSIYDMGAIPPVVAGSQEDGRVQERRR
jgi:hypothetical protein